MTRVPKIERKVERFPVVGEVKAVSESQGIVEGYLNVKNCIDLGDDRTLDGCFRKTLQDAYSRKKAQSLLGLWPYLYNHSYDSPPCGLIVDADEDRKGLFTRVQLNMDMQQGRDIFSAFKHGGLTSQSMGYKAHQYQYVKDEQVGRTIRNLLEVQIMEGSCVVFPMNTESTITAIKGRQDYNMLLRAKDFSERYTQQQLSDWAWDDWQDIVIALKQAVQDLFTVGDTPLQDFETLVLPDLAQALRNYISAGIALGAADYLQQQNNGSSDYGMMSLAGAGIEGKAGYLSAEHHTGLIRAADNIANAARDIKKRLASVSPSARRYNESVGQPLYSGASDRSIFEQKEDEANIMAQLALISTGLEVDLALKEGRQVVESTMDPLTVQQARVNAAIQGLIKRG